MYVFVLILFSTYRDNTFPLSFNAEMIYKSNLWCYGSIKIRKQFFVTYHMIATTNV